MRKICIFGPESTGKSVLTKRLAGHYRTVFVGETGRELVDARGLSPELMPTILEVHAQRILDAERQANRYLFVDTDHLTTLYYSRSYFGYVPMVLPWVENANRFDEYFFLDTDVPYVQDPQRSPVDRREEQKGEMLEVLAKAGIKYRVVGGDYEERFREITGMLDRKAGLDNQAGA